MRNLALVFCAAACTVLVFWSLRAGEEQVVGPMTYAFLACSVINFLVNVYQVRLGFRLALVVTAALWAACAVVTLLRVLG